METLSPGKEAVKEEKFTNSRKPCHRRVCGEFWNLRGQHNLEKNKNKKHTEYLPNRNCQQRSSPDSPITDLGVLDREARTACLGWGLNALRTI